jgi:hypothetical protein
MSDRKNEMRQIPANSTPNAGALIGVLSGLGYALGAWGVESVLLSTANGMYPFLKLLIGALLCALIGTLARVLCRRAGSLFLQLAVWAGAGVLFNRISIYLNFPGMQKLLGLLDAQLAPYINYPLDYGVSTRGMLMLVITLVACGLFGLFFTFAVEAYVIHESARRWLPLLLWMGAFFAAGYLGASLNTNPMRDAVVQTDKSIQFAIEHAGEDLPTETKSALGLFGLKVLEPYLGTPYRLISGSYDTQLVNIKVLAEIGERYALCPVINNRLGTCTLVR